MKLVFAYLVAAFLSSGCGYHKGFSYDFTDNGCHTGKHEFSTVEEMCAALKNDALNKNCAHYMRKLHYEAHCKDR